MIPRYTPQAFAELWSAATRYQAWLEVELAACEAMEHAGLVPAGVAARLRERKLTLDADRIEAIEATVKHDVIAFLTHVEELAGPDARWLHFGMTSSDVLDSSFALLLKRAAALLATRLDALVDALAARVQEHRKTPMIGRSHGIHAEPTTFGMALASHLAELKRCRRRQAVAAEEIAVGKVAGAVGTYAHLSADIEAEALGSLGLAPETVSTQVVARDRHAAFFSALALTAAAIERLATNVRHWQRTEVGEAEEAFGKGQKGSSAMPHKKNPIASENLCGLARVVRAAVTPALEDVALWHERDISHSSVERMIAPDATATLGFMLERATGLCAGLRVHPERLAENLAMTAGLCFSEGVMLALVRAGKPRQEAYVLVQRAALHTLDQRAQGGRDFAEGEERPRSEPGKSFAARLAEDPEVTALLSTEELARCFSLDHALRHTDAVIERALALP